ncbi:MAG: PspC domain-containing protein, partial [Flavobacterium sp.]|nr:PspC domain-containing protein [Flavobacterium sp.]
KLSRYFDAIKRTLSNSKGQDEIMKDIEMRVAELLQEKQQSDKHVVNIDDVDAVITVMGQPEDYRIDEENSESTTGFSTKNNNVKKLYRDKESSLIGGVCAGLGHYFGIDKVWIRIFLFLLVWFWGTGVLAYIILWIVMPEATTTSEKLEMTGSPVTILNIEKKVREEFDSVSQKFKNGEFDELGNKIKLGASRVSGNLGDVIVSIFKVFAKFLGGLVVLISAILLVAVCVTSIIMIFSTALPNNTILNYFHTPIGLETPLWMQGILFLFAFGIPLFFLLILGLKLLITNLKSIGNIAKYTLLALWIIATSLLVLLGINEASQRAFDGKVVQKQELNIKQNDTLILKFKNNDFYDKKIDGNVDYKISQDENGKTVLYSNNVSIELLKTDAAKPYFEIEKLAEGKTMFDAKQKAEKIRYNFTIKDNVLIFDNYFLTDFMQQFRNRNQKVEIFLYLPKGTFLKPDASVQNYDDSDDDYFNLHFSDDKFVYKAEENKLKCLNCPNYENEFNDVNSVNDSLNEINNDSTSTLILNEDRIIIKKSIDRKNNKETKTIKVNGKEFFRVETEINKN